MAYYNEGLAVWEPVIEPVEDDGAGYRPWELKVKVNFVNEPGLYFTGLLRIKGNSLRRVLFVTIKNQVCQDLMDDNISSSEQCTFFI